ncbi:modular serine protease-like isoform X2 [Venturia canescens]|uniref:modular serine protease-like isoform X2 n=1 Tax=Venturia canescens TaxID=32260 RepID=UPI001C9C3B81|nr:modular serine protease-like isoform X2 [Venturia canescens]
MKFPCRLETFSTIFIFALSGITNSKSLTVDRSRQTSNCGSLSFRCANGECIAGHLLCDGRADCSDGSDETRQECSRPEIVCPEFAFRCDYGGCVDGDAICNGIDDCVDKSDELLPRCNNSASSATCTSREFRCNNGQCIASSAMCDGTTDCSDRSDETSVVCGGINCPRWTFRCNYGACIDSNLKCNGVRNCADGSDEDRILCRSSNNGGTDDSNERPTGFSSRPTTTEPPRRTRPPCRLPSQPNNGRWRLHKSQCQNDQHCDPRSNTYELDPGTYLIYTCNEGYKINGTGDVFCGPEGKWSNEPECVEIRCKPLSTASTEADCRYNDEWISCESPVPLKTTAIVSCRNSYRSDSTILSSQRKNVKCNARGQWEPEPIRCSPECGQIPMRSKPLIVNGELPKISEFPWHATLYRSDTPNGHKSFICGATIIQSDLLITAAHCVFDESTKQVEDADKFAIATGNIFQEFNTSLHNPNIVKKAKVKRIFVNCNYLGLEGNFARDIAILHIDRPFIFSSILMPACLDVSAFSDQSVLEVGNYGKVAGFGKTALGNSSQVLQSLNVPYISLNECKASSSDRDNEKFITIDKFCAGYRNGSSVCDGDSGGGLVFKTGGLWYLRGLVSIGLGATVSGGTRSCDSHAYSLYTKISSHIEWIQDVILKLEMYNTFPSCPVKSRSRESSK